MIEPLVSVIVITYNSSKHVIETLESIKEQTYQNIELIISDDFSQDNTVTICEEWIEKNSNRFIDTCLIKSNKNTGISQNFNRGLFKARGKWVKFIAGDDTLELNIISHYISYISSNAHVKCLYSNVREYKNEFNNHNIFPIKNISQYKINHPAITAIEQFKILLNESTVWASTLFFEKQLLLDIGGFNENYPMFEDRPILLAITNSGEKIYYVDIIGAKYRRHTDSVQIKNLNKFFLTKHREDVLHFFSENYLEFLTIKERKKRIYLYKKNIFMKRIFRNKKNSLIRLVSFSIDLLIIKYIYIRY